MPHVTKCLLVAMLGIGGCTTSLGPVGLLAPDEARGGVKLLRPAVSGGSCRATLLGFRLGSGRGTIQEAMGEILALDAEGNAVVEAEVGRREFVTGVYNRRCVRVRGDLVRVITTVTLPSAPGHHGHH
jgi:hypothetical protein